MATKSVALAPQSGVQDVLNFPSVRALWRSIGVESAYPYLVAATTVVIAAVERDGDWPLFLFAGPAGELQLVDLGKHGGADVDLPAHYRFVCAVPRLGCGCGLSNCRACTRRLGEATRRVAERLSAHYSEQELSVSWQ